MHYQAQSNDGERYRPVDYEEDFLYSVAKIPDPDDQQKYSCRLWHGSRVVILKIEKSQ